MSYRSLRSSTLKNSFAQLDDFLINQPILGFNEGLLLNEIQKQENWLHCIKISYRAGEQRGAKKHDKDGFRLLEGSQDENCMNDFNDEDLFISLRNSKIQQNATKEKLKENELMLELDSLYESSDDKKESVVKVDMSPIKGRPKLSRRRPSKVAVLQWYNQQNSLNKARKKIWVMAGLFSEGAKLEEDIPEGSNEMHTNELRFKFELPETNILQNKDYKLPWNIYCPETMDNHVHVEQFTGFELLDDNVYEEKLNSEDQKPFIINGVDILGKNDKLISIYKAYKEQLKFSYVRQGVEIFDTEVKGYGLRAIREYEPGSLIMEYTGEILSYKEFNNLETSKDYCMHFVDGFVINAYKRGSLARFINHSSLPNCRFEIFLDANNVPKIGIFAKNKTIYSGEELTLNYNFNRVYNIKPERCYCGEDACKGFIRWFYKKLHLIHFLNFEDYFSPDGSANVRGISSLMKITNSTSYSSKKLKKLSTYCANLADEDKHISYFYVAGINDAYKEELEEDDDTSINPQYYHGPAYWGIDRLDSNLDENETNDDDIYYDIHNNIFNQGAKKYAFKIQAPKIKKKKTAGKRKKHSNSEERIKKIPRQNRTNGSEDFSRLPARLKKQLGIDMVTENL